MNEVGTGIWGRTKRVGREGEEVGIGRDWNSNNKRCVCVCGGGGGTGRKGDRHKERGG